MFISETYNTLFMAKKGVLTYVLNFTQNKFSYYNYANRTLCNTSNICLFLWRTFLIKYANYTSNKTDYSKAFYVQ